MDASKDEEEKKFGMDLKIILIGNVSTGKTSIIDRYVKNIFNEKCRATIGPNFSHKIIKKKWSNISFTILGYTWTGSYPFINQYFL